MVTKVLCFDCGSTYIVPEGTVNATKLCPACKDKLEDELIGKMFGDL